jgi:hypothetical protein
MELEEILLIYKRQITKITKIMNIRISSPVTRVFYGYDLNDRL